MNISYTKRGSLTLVAIIISNGPLVGFGPSGKESQNLLWINLKLNTMNNNKGILKLT